MSTSTVKAYLTGFTIGGLLATTVTLLYAPRSGEETRTMLRDRSEEAQEKTRQFLADSQQRANEVFNRKTSEALDEASALLDQGKEYVETTKKKVANS